MYRIIYSDNAVLSDFSTNLDNYHAGSQAFTLVAAQDAIYIGAPYAFNSLYLKIASANAETSAMSVSYWVGSQGWKSAVEVIDETAASGATLAQSGFVTFVPDKNWGWVYSDTVKSNGTEEITGLGDVTIYDLFWVKLTFSANLTADTTLSWVGQVFCSDEEIYTEFPLFNKSAIKTAIEAGKTTWEEQRVQASKILVDDLVAKRVINSGLQLLDRRKLINAAVSKTAELIFGMMGDDYNDDRLKARSEYLDRLNRDIFGVDSNNDGRLDKHESAVRQGMLYR